MTVSILCVISIGAGKVGTGGIDERFGIDFRVAYSQKHGQTTADHFLHLHTTSQTRSLVYLPVGGVA